MAQAEAERPGAVRSRPRLGATIGRSAVLAAALLLPGACSLFGEDEPPLPCPGVVRPSDTDHLTRFDGAGRDLTDVVFQARIRDVTATCEYEDDDTVIESSMFVTFEVERGPALRRLQDAEDDRVGFTYFVAVATNDEEPRILTREAFEVEASFEGNSSRGALVDEIAPRIPLNPGEDGRDYSIYVGIEMNRAELDYNRQNR